MPPNRAGAQSRRRLGAPGGRSHCDMDGGAPVDPHRNRHIEEERGRSMAESRLGRRDRGIGKTAVMQVHFVTPGCSHTPERCGQVRASKSCRGDSRSERLSCDERATSKARVEGSWRSHPSTLSDFSSERCRLVHRSDSTWQLMSFRGALNSNTAKSTPWRGRGAGRRRGRAAGVRRRRLGSRCRGPDGAAPWTTRQQGHRTHGSSQPTNT